MSNLAPRLVFLAAICATGVPAQALRYQVGLRVRAFELEFDRVVGDLEARERVCPTLEKAVTAFFALRLQEVGRLLDTAGHVLSKKPASAAVRWAESLSLYPDSRLVDCSAKELPIRIKHLYRVEDAAPDGAKLRLSLRDAKGEQIGNIQTFPMDEVPVARGFEPGGVPEGDHRLRIEFVRGDELLARREQVISFAKDLDKRLAKVMPLADSEVKDTRTGTMRGLARTVRALSRNRTLETDVFSVRALRDLERLQAGGGLLSGRSGDFRVWLASGRGATAARVFVPEGIDPQKKRALVVAMHGAGGSENLFFDGYGAGKIVELCRARGWLLVAPRSAMFGRGGGAERIVGELAKLLPIDRARVFGVGHSMGSGQLMGQASAKPKLFRAVASLGGGGQVRASEALTRLPVFVGAGDRDFGMRMAKSLDAALRRAEVETLEFKTYEATEHLGIVQVALSDVFAFFDRALLPRKN